MSQQQSAELENQISERKKPDANLQNNELYILQSMLEHMQSIDNKLSCLVSDDKSLKKTLKKTLKKLRKLKKQQLQANTKLDVSPSTDDEPTHQSYLSSQAHEKTAKPNDEQTYPPLGHAFAPWFTLLDLFLQDTELTGLLANIDTQPSDNNETQEKRQASQLIALIANLAQWDKVEAIWRALAIRCKQEKRAATDIERQLLQGAVDIHNLTWQDKKASLQSMTVPVPYHYTQHLRGNAQGDTVIEQWLPALLNPAGQVVQNPLVFTQ